MTSSRHGPYKLGFVLMCYINNVNKMPKIWANQKKLFKFVVFSETWKYKKGIASNYRLERYSE